jgi:hypothetical protein
VLSSIFESDILSGDFLQEREILGNI